MLPVKIVLDTDTLRPNHLCRICRLPLNANHEPLVIVSDGAITKSRNLYAYHAICHDNRNRVRDWPQKSRP